MNFAIHRTTTYHVILHSPDVYGTHGWPLNDLFPGSRYNWHWAKEFGNHGQEDYPYGKKRHKTKLGNPRPVVTAHCNATHRVSYAYASLLEEVGERVPDDEAVHVYRYTPDLPDFYPRVKNITSTNLHLTLEPPSHLYYNVLPEEAGYAGSVDFRRSSLAVRRLIWPITTWREVQKWSSVADKAPDDEAVKRWLRGKSSIGMYVDNCVPGRPTWRWRMPVMEALSKSHLPVESYGKCLRNRNESKKLEKAKYHGKEQFCTRHRLLLAVENAPCEDWISPNLAHALIECGSIPIVKTFRRGDLADTRVPDYHGYLGGRLPLVDASEPDWLDEIEQLLNNDTHYLATLRAAGQEARRVLAHIGAESGAAHTSRDLLDDETEYHCAWFRIIHTPRQRISWKECEQV